ncbi:MAG: hypothetical protein HUJ86_05810, partial [Synergistes sp.]|nr:hypothetical protein [Synergistes sp.]
MRLVTLKINGGETAGVKTKKGVVLIERINEEMKSAWETDILSLIQTGDLSEMTEWYNNGGREEIEKTDAIPYEKCVFGPLYRDPKRIFGIGLNYVDHAGDIG